jgi:pSer/pThr/pTyr-binding forkhead associated (FHA) protein
MTVDNETTMTTHLGPQALLIVKQGPQIGIQFPLTAERYTIGRDESCDIIIQDAEVSRRHSQISWTEHGFVIQDLESTNGTFLNGSQLGSATPLKSGDNIGLGQTTLMFELQQAADQPAFEHGSPAQQSEQAGGKRGATSSFSGRRQRWLLVGCGCLLLLCVCGITAPAILQMAGIVDLATIGQGLGF